MNGNDALENLETGHMDVFYPQNGGREGLYIDIETALIYLFGPGPWLLRLPAAVFMYLLACFFMATSFWHVLFSRLGLRAIASPFGRCASCSMPCAAHAMAPPPPRGLF